MSKKDELPEEEPDVKSEDGDNGKIPFRIQLIKQGKVCGKCIMKVPSHAPIFLRIAPDPSKIVKPKQQEALPILLCGNPHSVNFQRMMGLNGSCACFTAAEEQPKIVEADEVPEKVKNRLIIGGDKK